MDYGCLWSRLEGESGANDPVGIALLVALLTATGTGMSAAGQIALEFGLQMAVGVVAGAVGGWALLAFMRRVPLPNEGLYSLRVLAGALAIYGLATVADGSGFLAVFIAGVLIGDQRAPYKSEIARFHSALASLAELVAFVMLGLTIRLYALPRGSAWLIGAGARGPAVVHDPAAARRCAVVAGAAPPQGVPIVRTPSDSDPSSRCRLAPDAPDGRAGNRARTGILLGPAGR